MANYYATTRSNYFRVKDAKAFEDWCNELNLEFWTHKPEADAETFYAISADTGDCGGWPTSRLVAREDDPDVDDDEEVDVAAELADYLHPSDAAVLMEIGNEKLRYLAGFAQAVHPDGRIVTISLAEIIDKAREVFGPDINITEAIY